MKLKLPVLALALSAVMSVAAYAAFEKGMPANQVEPSVAEMKTAGKNATEIIKSGLASDVTAPNLAVALLNQRFTCLHVAEGMSKNGVAPAIILPTLLGALCTPPEITGGLLAAGINQTDIVAAAVQNGLDPATFTAATAAGPAGGTPGNTIATNAGAPVLTSAAAPTLSGGGTSAVSRN
ncbi:hypothetical protein WAE56_10980 [Iodobacter sp. LRB]|uniref:hypothetical protein n=1 Tax=unclassified Iodobacter TaxID=235634 RepID=UPI000C0DBF3D|nr:hypothetical protein [Iodobacter sp. BJB302]PHV01226.1 hypothetical protein CSQ88_13235 [Iodobacter sp. BJB302]